MCSYDSTCDHLPLADLCLKEATHPSRKLNMDSISLGPPPPRPPSPRRIRSVHHFTDSLASLFSTKKRILSPFSTVSEGNEDVFDPSSQLPINV